MRLTRKVFWQSFWYMMAFYVSQPVLFMAFYWKYGTPVDFWILVLSGFMSPSQGFLNSLIHFHRSGTFKELDVIKQARRISHNWTGRIMSRRSSDRILVSGSLSEAIKSSNGGSSEVQQPAAASREDAEAQLENHSCLQDSDDDTAGPLRELSRGASRDSLTLPDNSERSALPAFRQVDAPIMDWIRSRQRDRNPPPREQRRDRGHRSRLSRDRRQRGQRGQGSDPLPTRYAQEELEPEHSEDARMFAATRSHFKINFMEGDSSSASDEDTSDHFRPLSFRRLFTRRETARSSTPMDASEEEQ